MYHSKIQPIAELHLLCLMPLITTYLYLGCVDITVIPNTGMIIVISNLEICIKKN